MARVLIGLGADVNAIGHSPHYSSPLHLAIHSPRIVDILLTNGANLETTALEHAVRQDAKETVDILVKHGAYLDIHSACRLGYVDRVRKLLRSDPSLANKEHFIYRDPNRTKGSSEPWNVAERTTPLSWAIGGRQTEIVRILLEHNADPNTAVFYRGLGGTVYPLHMVKEDSEIGKLLRKYGAVASH